MSVADVYDALTSDRPYRKALNHQLALTAIRRGSGSQFDPAIVNAFISKMNHATRKYPLKQSMRL
jgi:HD-GYP domain-containing protein (c-di-GMP phosphodiesterase class II)